MKLLHLKDTPLLKRVGILDVEDYISDTYNGGRSLDYTDQYFSVKCINFLEDLKKKVKVDKNFAKTLKGYRVLSDFKDATATIIITTNASKLTEVKSFVAKGLCTTSKLGELKGRRSRSRDEYTYELVFDMHDGEYDLGRRKMSSSGILRLAFLIDLLQRTLEEK